MKPNVLILDDSEKFIIYSYRYFDGFFRDFGYLNVIQNYGPYIVITYSSDSLKQDILITYDFLRSDKPYYQIEVILINKRGIINKEARIECIELIKGVIMPKTIEDTLALLKQCFCRNLLLVIKGQKWINEI
jgi:hypothetical protein